MTTGFRERLLSHAPLIGAIITLPDPSVTEIFVQAGYDWLWVDGEHSPLSPAEIQMIAQTAGSTPCLARVPSLDEAWIKKTLETGVAGIIVPLITSHQEAARAVALAKYPPEGCRSVGIGRAQAYGLGFDEYIRTANSQVSVVVQIEHIQVVDHLDEILDTAGVDAALVGPYDLSNSMGKPGQVDDPEVRAAIEHIRSRCAAKGVPIGIFTTSPAAARAWLAAGFTFIGVGVDVMLLAAAARRSLAEVTRSS